MRSIKTVCACFLALLIISGACLTAFAVEPSVEAGIHYKASGFYDRLLEVELTGDQRYDTVAVALSQLGYHEGDCEEDMDGLNGKGKKNFAEYTRVWGKVDNQEGNGVSYGYAWCAAFVSWCLRQAQVPTTVALTEISCNRMTNWYIKRDIFYSRDSGYTPILGDIIMFNEDNVITHVGLVLGVKDGRVYTVEGNGGEQVATHSYSLTSSYVHGYCVPQYTVKDGMDYVALMEGALNPVGKYLVTATKLAVMSEADSSSEKIASLSEGDEVEVIAIDGNWSKKGADWKEDALYATIRKHQPEAMIINNTGLSALGQTGHPELDSVTFEQGRPTPMNRKDMPKYVAAEMCYTMNDHWGIGKDDFNYKSSRELIECLCDCRRVGANLLLNVGPTAQGAIDPMQSALLGTMGRWNKLFGEAIYEGKPYNSWGMGKNFILQGDGCLYLFCYSLGRQGKAHVTAGNTYYGAYAFDNVKDSVKNVRWMDNGEELSFTQADDMLTVKMTGAPYGSSFCVRVAKAEI